MAAQYGRWRDRHRPETADHAPLHIHAQANCRVGDAAHHRHGYDAWHDEVDVLHRAGAEDVTEVAPEHVDEQQHQSNRHRHHRDDRVGAADDMAQAPPSHHPSVAEHTHHDPPLRSLMICRNASSSVGDFCANSATSTLAVSSKLNRRLIWATLPSVEMVRVRALSLRLG